MSRKLIERKGYVFHPKIISLTLGLLAIAGGLFWMLQLRWTERQAYEHAVLARSPSTGKLLLPPAIPMPPPISVKDYKEVVQKTLFAQDRNPNVTLEVKPAPPPTPMPQLPTYYGTMLLGEPVILLKFPKGIQSVYHAGEKVGPFHLVSFDRGTIVFDWDGNIIKRSPEELKEKDPAFQETSAASPAPVAQVNVKRIGVESLDDSSVSDKLGIDTGVGVRLCVSGDTSPAGTEVDGYRKHFVNGTFGLTCLWESASLR